MEQKFNQSTKQTYFTDWYRTRDELLTIIEQYLTAERKDEYYDEEIASVVWELLGSSGCHDNIHNYTVASVSALNTFASTDVAKILTEKMGTYKFNNLCNMLEGIIKLCFSIKEDELFMTLLDHMRWVFTGDSDSTLESIKNAKMKYERKLKNLMEDKLEGT